jgi:polysaccharide biosynthesis protein PslG
MTRSPSIRRARRITAFTLAAFLGCAGLATNALGTGAASADVPQAAPAGYALHKANFGLAPGAGFFLDEAHIRSGLDNMKTLGVHWIRSTIPWREFEPDDPTKLAHGEPAFNWKGVGQFVATLNQPAYKGSFAIIVTVESPPDWAMAKGRVGQIGCPRQPPFDLASYARATAALAAHLKGVSHVFEVENSPNIGTRSPAHQNPIAVWSPPNPCGYAQLLKLTTAAVHSLHIGALVLVGGIGGTRDIPNQRIAADEFLADLYANGARGAFDGVSFHPYSSPYLPCAPSASVCTLDPSYEHNDPYGMNNGWDRMLNARRIMVANGDSAKEIWITEFGGPTDGPKGASNVLTESQQAALLISGAQRASQYSWVAVWSWFTYQDGNADPQSDPGGNWKGLLQVNGAHKLAFGAYQRLTASAH